MRQYPSAISSASIRISFSLRGKTLKIFQRSCHQASSGYYGSGQCSNRRIEINELVRKLSQLVETLFSQNPLLICHIEPDGKTCNDQQRS